MAAIGAVGGVVDVIDLAVQIAGKAYQKLNNMRSKTKDSQDVQRRLDVQASQLKQLKQCQDSQALNKMIEPLQYVDEQLTDVYVLIKKWAASGKVTGQALGEINEALEEIDYYLAKLNQLIVASLLPRINTAVHNTHVDPSDPESNAAREARRLEAAREERRQAELEKAELAKNKAKYEAARKAERKRQKERDSQKKRDNTIVFGDPFTTFGFGS